MRIVSLLPSATEVLFAVGVGDQIVGVTHECDHPPAATRLTAVTEDLLAPGLSPREIDAAVARSVSDTHTIYRLDAAALRALEPDVVVTQDLCEVCAVPTETVEAVVCTMPSAARVVSSDPHTLDELFVSIRAIGGSVDAPGTARLLDEMASRLKAVRSMVAGLRRPRVAVLEWPDPPYVPGHWVPDMVEAAGGLNVLGTAGAKSVRVPWTELEAARPDLVVLAFCGYGLSQTLEQFAPLMELPEWHRFTGDARIVATNGSAYFSRPGPRLVDGVELLGYAIHRLERLRPAPGRLAELADGVWIDPATSQPIAATAES